MAAIGSFTDYLENAILNHVFGLNTFTPQSTYYVALFTTMPDDAGASGVEVSSGSYARVSITNNTTTFPNVSNSTKTNGISITFPAATANWGTVKGYGIYDAVSGGNLLCYGMLTDDRKIISANSSTDTFTSASHGYLNGDKVVVFNADGALPSGLTEYQNYYIISSTTNTFQLSSTLSGSAINITTAGTGVNYVAKSYIREVDTGIALSFESGSMKINLA